MEPITPKLSAPYRRLGRPGRFWSIVGILLALFTAIAAILIVRRFPAW